MRSALATADAFMRFPFTGKTALDSPSRMAGKGGATGSGNQLRERRDENKESHSRVAMAIRVPAPFRGSAKMERFPRTFSECVEKGED